MSKKFTDETQKEIEALRAKSNALGKIVVDNSSYEGSTKKKTVAAVKDTEAIKKQKEAYNDLQKTIAANELENAKGFFKDVNSSQSQAAYRKERQGFQATEPLPGLTSLTQNFPTGEDDMKANFDGSTLPEVTIFDTLADKLDRFRVLYADTASQVAEKGDLMGQVFLGMADAMTAASASGVVSFAQLAAAALSAAADIIAGYIRVGVAAAVANAFKNPAGVIPPVGLALAAMAGAAASTLFKGIIGKIAAPKLAKGGLAYAPTMAMVGDNRNARVDPEVIAPLSKLKGMLGNTDGGGYIASTRIEGNDLLLVVERAEQRRTRSRGF
jgi:hypothetical protein